MSNLTSKRMRRCVIVAVLTIAGVLLVHGNAAAQQEQEESAYAIMSEGHLVHVLPTVSKTTELAGAGLAPTPLTYHGGPVMTKANTYAIFWAPATLQTGAPTSLSTHYQNVQTALLSLYSGHGIDNNNTQYYMTSGGFIRFTSWVQSAGGFVASYVDTSPYPASGCKDVATPGNCLSDAQVQAEIKKVITLKGWPVGINYMFLLYTSSGEGSCLSGDICAYSGFPEAYCAYHSYFLSGSSPVIYGNMPYANLNVCQVPGTPSPNGDQAADEVASTTSHELTEAITDPELNAWYDGSGAEIGDKCAYNYGANTWGTANQSWWEFFNPFITPFSPRPIGYFELQQEYDNHTGSCVQLGP